VEKEDERPEKKNRGDYREGPGSPPGVREGAFAVRMDVTDQESIDAAVSEVTSRVAPPSEDFCLVSALVAAGLTFLETMVGRCAKLIKVRQA
jgi:NAD(P)-dependent dehydrogenase (short-subunit alcohol dehydrogenase family)